MHHARQTQHPPFRVATPSAWALAAMAVFISGCAAPERLTQKVVSEQQLAQTATKQSMNQTPLVVGAATPGSALAIEAKAQALTAPRQVARKATVPFVGARMVDVQSDQLLPAVFHEPLNVTVDDKGRPLSALDKLAKPRISIGVFAERLSRYTGVPVRIAPDVYSGLGLTGGARPTNLAQAAVGMPQGMTAGAAGLSAAGANTPISLVPTGAGGMPPMAPGVLGAPSLGVRTPSPVELGAFTQNLTDVNSVEVNWSGTPASLLDQVTAILNLSWSYRDGAVVVERFVTESFELSAFGGKQAFKLGLSGGNSGSGGATGSTSQAASNMDVTETGSAEVLASFLDTVRQIVGKSGGNVVLNEATGRLIVTAPRDTLNPAREVIRTEDAAMARQVQIQFDVYSVINTDIDERGVNWDMLLNNVWAGMVKSPATLTGSSAGQLGVSILKGDASNSTSARFGGSALIVNALNQLGESSSYKPITVLAQNRQWGRKTNLLSEGYISETTPATASSAGSGAPGLRTSTISTGEKVLVQPAIMDNGSVLLRFGLSMSALLGLTDQTTGSGSTLQKVQTPTVSGSDDQSTVRLQPGEALVLTGLSRRFASQDRRTLTEDTPVALGGSRKAQVKREDFLVVVRAVPL